MISCSNGSAPHSMLCNDFRLNNCHSTRQANTAFACKQARTAGADAWPASNNQSDFRTAHFLLLVIKWVRASQDRIIVIVRGLCSLALAGIGQDSHPEKGDSTIPFVLSLSVGAKLEESGARMRVSLDIVPGHYDQGGGQK